MLTKENTGAGVAIAGPRFTARERATLDLLLEGHSSKEIAYLLEVSPRTIDHRIERMCDRAGVWSRRELLLWALKRACWCDGRTEVAAIAAPL